MPCIASCKTQVTPQLGPGPKPGDPPVWSIWSNMACSPMLTITLVSIGATLAGNKLNGVFSTVAMAMQQPGSAQNILSSRPTSFGQRTNRKGAPVERDVSGKLTVLTAF